MALPVLVAVEEDPEVLARVEAQLGQRYGRDYQVVDGRRPADALRTLAELREADDEVALVLAGQT